MTESTSSSQERWARLRFAVVGPLLGSPPADGELRVKLEKLSKLHWQHPVHEGQRIRFAVTTIERWYYIAKKAKDPFEALRRTVRGDAGKFKSISDELRVAVHAQHRQYGYWTYRLHYDNLAALVRGDPSLGRLPSYPTLVRFMKAEGLRRSRRHGNRRRPGLELARDRLERREVRSFEVEHVGGLWHLDFHTSRHVGVLLPDGNWVRPTLLALLDDHSRLCCHAQFYLEETAAALAHGLTQAILKRGVPRGLLTDNGAAMTAAEFTEGLERLSIVHYTTLPYSPHQNGKQEHFFAVVEGRFLAMLDGIQDLTIERINSMLQAWVEGDYHRAVHSETKQTPVERFLGGSDVLRPSPDPKAIREAFRQHVTRRLRRSDTTVTIDGIRYEVPSAYRHLDRIRAAYARWDLGFVHLVDPKTGRSIVRLHPLDRSKNASGARRPIEPTSSAEVRDNEEREIPPFLKQLLEEYAASGLPPGYLPDAEPSSRSREHDDDDDNDQQERVNEEGETRPS